MSAWSLYEPDTGTEAADDVDGVPDARLLRGLIQERERKEDFAFGGIGRALREDSDDGVGGAVECDGAANNLRIAAEETLPRGCAEDGDVVAAVLIVLLIEEAAVERGDAECGEEIARGEDAMDLLGVAVHDEETVSGFLTE